MNGVAITTEIIRSPHAIFCHAKVWALPLSLGSRPDVTTSRRQARLTADCTNARVEVREGRGGALGKKKNKNHLPGSGAWLFHCSNNTRPLEQWWVYTSRADASESDDAVTQENHVMATVVCCHLSLHKPMNRTHTDTFANSLTSLWCGLHFIVGNASFISVFELFKSANSLTVYGISVGVAHFRVSLFQESRPPKKKKKKHNTSDEALLSGNTNVFRQVPCAIPGLKNTSAVGWSCCYSLEINLSFSLAPYWSEPAIASLCRFTEHLQVITPPLTI